MKYFSVLPFIGAASLMSTSQVSSAFLLHHRPALAPVTKSIQYLHPSQASDLEAVAHDLMKAAIVAKAAQQDQQNVSSDNMQIEMVFDSAADVPGASEQHNMKNNNKSSSSRLPEWCRKLFSRSKGTTSGINDN